jgi:hypothetical protein
VIYEAVNYICRVCGDAVGTVRRNTDFVDDDTLAWTLRVTIGPSPEAVEPAPAAVHPSRRTVADIDYVVVGYGSNGPRCWIDRGSLQDRSGAGVFPYCLRCATGLEILDAYRVHRDLRQGISTDKTQRRRLSRRNAVL